MRKFVNYCKEAFTELTKKVTWPTWEKLQSSAFLVMIATVLIAAVVFAMDYVFQHLMMFIYTL